MSRRKVNVSADPILGTITGLTHDTRGITTVNGKTTFVEGALPGESVTFKLTKKKPRYNEAETLDIHTTSPDRVKPECGHFGVCGGCSMQHIHSEAQIAFKQKTLLDQLKHFGKVEADTLLPPISGNPWGYRRKARLGVRYVEKKERMFVGFREKSSRYLAEIDMCHVLHPTIGKRLNDLKILLMTLKHYMDIPQIEVAVGDHDTALIFRHMVDLPEDDINKLIAFGKEHHFHIYLQPNLPATVHKIFPADNNEKLTYALPAYDLEMQFHPLDFTQVNREINLLMLQRALELLELTSNDTVLDLFCGLGNFTLPIARTAKKVVGVEGSEEMVLRADDNAQHNGIHNTEFYAADLSKMPTQKPKWMLQQYDKLLLDPPRTGAKEIIEWLPQLKIKRIVYVSCNPATLARDAGELVNNLGYKLKKIGVINMFPHTSHIEAIALFEK